MTDAAVHWGHGTAQSVGAGHKGTLLSNIHILLAELVAAWRQSESGHCIRHQDDSARMRPMSDSKSGRMSVDPIGDDSVVDGPVRNFVGGQEAYETGISVVKLF